MKQPSAKDKTVEYINKELQNKPKDDISRGKHIQRVWDKSIDIALSEQHKQHQQELKDQKAKMIEIIKNKIDNRLFDGISRLFANTRCDNIETIARKTRILTNSFKLDVEQLKEFVELR